MAGIDFPVFLLWGHLCFISKPPHHCFLQVTLMELYFIWCWGSYKEGVTMFCFV